MNPHLNLHQFRVAREELLRNMPAAKRDWLNKRLRNQMFEVHFDGVEAWSFFTAQIEHAFGDSTAAVFAAMATSIEPASKADQFCFYLRTTRPEVYGKVPAQIWVLGFELFKKRQELDAQYKP